MRMFRIYLLHCPMYSSWIRQNRIQLWVLLIWNEIMRILTHVNFQERRSVFGSKTAVWSAGSEESMKKQNAATQNHSLEISERNRNAHEQGTFHFSRADRTRETTSNRGIAEIACSRHNLVDRVPTHDRRWAGTIHRTRFCNTKMLEIQQQIANKKEELQITVLEAQSHVTKRKTPPKINREKLNQEISDGSLVKWQAIVNDYPNPVEELQGYTLDVLHRWCSCRSLKTVSHSLQKRSS